MKTPPQGKDAEYTLWWPLRSLDERSHHPTLYYNWRPPSRLTCRPYGAEGLWGLGHGCCGFPS